MSLLSWNCRGLGNPGQLWTFARWWRRSNPGLCFLMETKIRNVRMQSVRITLGFDGMLTVDPVGLSGGIALLWKQSEEVEIQTYSQRHISAWIKGVGSAGPWLFTGFYGDPDSAKREFSWRLLTHLRPPTSLPWLCVGDFNEICDHSEKSGGAIHSEHQMAMFRDTLEACHLYDLGYIGPRFTWSNCRDSEQHIMERLDRATATHEWCTRFRDAKVLILAARSSDHNPVCVFFSKGRSSHRRRRIFRFEASWNLDAQSSDIVKNAWTGIGLGDGAMQSVRTKLAQCQRALVQWSSSKYRNSA
ncbi:hypothetical protein SLA2020_434340 [Shorea laevis]